MKPALYCRGCDERIGLLHPHLVLIDDSVTCRRCAETFRPAGLVKAGPLTRWQARMMAAH